ncbi:LysR family transcriptional regulator [Neorhizobium alkalisoli]|uniref:LysR family transcriptional regulator n=1 Tax=Neorhizobium alkalisoli TaxID=528178 RepID=A0A561R9M7_9HYPH|nr:LysR family transcriptional regulator [Neorhizobium alkalisoli]TWF59307.1 LysR family transcriptional regulator [Neorhizobium alkalisoli]
MHIPNINSIDLNLLKVFDAVYREGNVAAAARRMGMSQPAASHALARLRHALGDDLFVRSARGMLPTARAEQVAGPIRQALGYLELGLQSHVFDPATSTHRFSVALDNCSAIALTARILSGVSQAAPGVSIHLRPSGTIDVDGMMDASELDLFIGRPGESRERFCSQVVSSDPFVVVHPGHSNSLDGVMSVEELVSTPHLQLSSTGDDTSFLDAWLEKQGLKRTVQHSVPLLGYTSELRQKDLLVVMRRPIAEVISGDGGLSIRQLPFASPLVDTCLRWHRRVDTNPAHVWLREMIGSIVARVGTAKDSSLA